MTVPARSSHAVTTLVALALAIGVLPPAAGQAMTDVEIKVTPVSGPVHMLEGRGGNIGVSAGDDGVLIVDDQFEELAPKIAEALGKLGSRAPRFVLNTHFHGDHTGGNATFGKEGTIVAHDNVRARLAGGANVLGRDVPPAPPAALPVITFDESLSIHFNGERIRVLHFPRAHTDGDGIVFFEGSNVVHMGDTFFSGSFPFVDVQNGGSVQGLIEGLKGLLAELEEDVRIIPGHGPLSTKRDLATYVGMLEQTSAIVKAGIDGGLSLDEIVKTGLPEKWKGWGDGFINEERWIGILHGSLGGRKAGDLGAAPWGPIPHGHGTRR